jgi:hypothetical protein
VQAALENKRKATTKFPRNVLKREKKIKEGGALGSKGKKK